MSQTPEISVILSTYNRHRPQGDCPSLFERALKSILNQTFSDFELVLIDDASTDGTAALCQQYAAQDPRIKLISHSKNSQLPAKCYNEGIEKSSGRFVTFMFDDDVWFPNALTDLYDFFNDKLKNDPHLGMVYGLTEFYECDKLIDPHFGLEWNLHNLFHYNYLSNCGVMIRRDVIDVVGSYDEHPILRRVCDWDLWQRIGRKYHVLRMNKIIGQIYQKQSDSIGILFDWTPSKARFYRLFRTKYPLKKKASPWPQKMNYLKSFFVIYIPKAIQIRQYIKKTLLLIGCWKFVKPLKSLLLKKNFGKR